MNIYTLIKDNIYIIYIIKNYINIKTMSDAIVIIVIIFFVLFLLFIIGLGYGLYLYLRPNPPSKKLTEIKNGEHFVLEYGAVPGFYITQDTTCEGDGPGAILVNVAEPSAFATRTSEDLISCENLTWVLTNSSVPNQGNISPLSNTSLSISTTATGAARCFARTGVKIQNKDTNLVWDPKSKTICTSGTDKKCLTIRGGVATKGLEFVSLPSNSGGEFEWIPRKPLTKNTSPACKILN